MAPKRSLPRSITAILRRLRRRIRRYVWLQGLFLACAWLGLAYWVGLALDYLPVLAGSSEMPRPARLVLLGVVAAVLIWIIYRWIIRRAFVPIHDGNLAVLLERRFPLLNDTLLTAVSRPSPGDHQLDTPADTPKRTTAKNNATPSAPATVAEDAMGRDIVLHQAMFDRAVALADERTRGLDSRQVLNYRPLLRSGLAALTGTLSIVLFAVLAQDAWAIWTSRFLLLSDHPWPRRTAIEVLDFPNRLRKVAEGSDLTIRVRADQSRYVPDTCTIDYRFADGDRGRVNMSRDGEPRAGYQYYRYQGAPFQGMLEAVQFDVVGFDYRAADYRVEIVASPSITEVRLDCELPDYMNQVPRQLTWAPGTSVPAGTRVQLVAVASKPLREVQIENLDTGEFSTLELDPATPADERQQFQIDLGTLSATTALRFELLDDDRVRSDQPYLVSISALEDTPPQVDMRLSGIGTAITPDARLPVQGEMTDDYGIRKRWFEINVPDREATYRVKLDGSIEGEFETVLDLRRQRTRDDRAWEVRPGEKILFGMRATDDYDLDDQPHLGSTDDFPLDVVTADELLALLEARELGLKERFEQVIAELSETRDSLLRLQADLSSVERKPELETVDVPEVDANGEQSASANLARQNSIRHLRVQRAEQQGSKSHQEAAGVGESFADIREQLINNRVDTPERTRRLQQQIIEPIETIVENQFPNWLEHLALLDQQLDDPDLALPMTEQSVAMANELIVALQGVLQSMLELETYNELVDLVRSIINEQERLQKETAEERKRQARGLLED